MENVGYVRVLEGIDPLTDPLPLARLGMFDHKIILKLSTLR